MKKLFLFALMAIAAISFNACSKDDNGGETWVDDSPIIEFKDPKFLEILLLSHVGVYDDIKIDRNGDGQISEKEAQSALYLHISNNIRTMDEIRYFTSLTDFSCNSNQLSSLNIDKNISLQRLCCEDNQLTSLDVSKNTALTFLDCGSNQLTSLDLSKNIALTELLCGGNQLTKLDIIKNTILTKLDCAYNQLISLDISTNSTLTELVCSYNLLTSLDLDKKTELTFLYCGNNQLTSLDVSKCKKLKLLECSGNSNLKSITLYKYHVIGQTYLDKIIKEYGDIITYVE